MPEGWAWCRLGNTVKDIADIDHKMPEIKEEGIPFISPIDFTKDGKIDFQNAKKISKSDFERLSQKIKPSVNDIIFPRYGTIGVLRLVNSDLDFLVSYSCATIVTDKVYSNPKYIYYALQTSLAQSEINKYKVTTTQSNIGIKSLKQFFIPLAPLAEQQCIVSSIESIFAQIDMLEQNKSNLETAIKQAKFKILDLAIHGKLVPQDPNDESAEELLKRIATSDNRPYKKFEGEEPFDLPDTWEWCNLDDIYNHTTGKALKKSNSTGTLHKYITTSNLYWNSFDFTEVRSMYFTDEELEKCTIKKGDLILCNGGDVGRAAIWNYDYDICYQNHVSRLRPKSVDINNYFYLYLLMLYKESGLLAGKGIGITSLSASDLLTTTLPLPPLAEQQRIVTKIEELFAQLDSISEQLA